MPMRGRRIVPAVNTLSHRGSGGTGGQPLIGIGIAFLIFWLVCLMTQISTNEAWINAAGSIDVYRPNWSVFLQIPMLILGQIPADQTNGVVFAWGVELIFLAITIAGIELIHSSVHQSGRILGIIFEIVAFGASCFNWYTDFLYGSVGSQQLHGQDIGHAFFAFMTSIVVAYFGVIGWNLVKVGWSRV
jgi:hypothetical protein